ncbi:hypothetical protein [Rhizobium leguminosarum]|uniref:hypothetical protein n=1 Tax=Rhizobium leguminosarum TaxID=384 RepID=UPI00124AACC3|nr:hypothetical protein [Rhizobium leguminosarum]
MKDVQRKRWRQSEAGCRGAEIYPKTGRKDNFRNPDGVALKLQNLQSAVDPTRRLSSSRRDREAVAEFPQSRRDELAHIAAASYMSY